MTNLVRSFTVPIEHSLDWFKGKITGNVHIWWYKPWFPLDFPINQSNETRFDFPVRYVTPSPDSSPASLPCPSNLLIPWWLACTSLAIPPKQKPSNVQKTQCIINQLLGMTGDGLYHFISQQVPAMLQPTFWMTGVISGDGFSMQKCWWLMMTWGS